MGRRVSHIAITEGWFGVCEVIRTGDRARDRRGGIELLRRSA
jgi:hypothetical protein